MKRAAGAFFVAFLFGCFIYAQDPSQAADQSETTLRISSRAVLVDVVVTDHSGKPVHGLPREAFTIVENGKPQAVNFFEEHSAAARNNAPPVSIPHLPANTFTNRSPFPEPPVVNVLLLDSLNTQMADQSYVHAQALKFLSTMKPGSRMAIFGMGLGLHFIQGFNDDPAVLVAALKNRKNNEVESSVMLKGQDETTMQQHLMGMMSATVNTGGGPVSGASPGAVESLSKFIQENDGAQQRDRMILTLDNLQKLAHFLEGFPGRKNVIWFGQSVPGIYGGGALNLSSADASIENKIKITLAMLSAARVALYPVEPSGVTNYSLYSAETNLAHAGTAPSAFVGGNGRFAQTITAEGQVRNSNQASAQMLADDSGGHAFANTNDLSKVMSDVTGSSADFYSIAYAPSDNRMDGQYRNITVSLSHGDYRLSYRRGYYALDEALPGSSVEVRDAQLRKIAAQSGGVADPLLPSMSLGMPQSQQLAYTAKVQIVPPEDDDDDVAAAEKGKTHYSIDFSVDINDVKFTPAANGMHNGLMDISIVAYDRYGNVIARKDHHVDLSISPDTWASFQQNGVQLHADLLVPAKGNFWLRTGIYDRGTRKLGTLELALAAVKPVQISSSE